MLLIQSLYLSSIVLSRWVREGLTDGPQLYLLAIVDPIGGQHSTIHIVVFGQYCIDGVFWRFYAGGELWNRGLYMGLSKKYS